jgi:arylsulfatase A-like enzyme
VTNNPVCTPARTCFLSGQHSRTCMGRLGNMDNGEVNELGWSAPPKEPPNDETILLAPTLPEQLRSAGYETALFGKWHVDKLPANVGFDRSLHPANLCEPDGRWAFIENSSAPQRVDDLGDEYVSQRVCDYLETRDSDKPLFLFYSIYPPHMPLLDAPDQYLTMYSPDEIPLRPNVWIDGQLPVDDMWFRIYLWEFQYYWHRQPWTEELPDGFDLRAMTALYYGLVSWIDDLVGRLMASLDQAGMAENTIIVFTSDHGDNLGSHHRWNKDSLNEEAIRIPMIFHAPGRWVPAVNVSQVASLIDLMPTLLAACHDEPPADTQGRDLTPILTGQREALDETYSVIETSQGDIGIRTPTHMYGINRPSWWRDNKETEFTFHDLRSDPYQLTNLIDTSQQAELARALAAVADRYDQTTPWLKGPTR